MTKDEFERVKEIERDYKKKDSHIDAGNLFWALGKAIDEIERLNKTLQDRAGTQREWVGLTDEERDKLALDSDGWHNQTLLEITLYVETKLKEKNT